jgi:hypothetical protein
MMNDRDFEIEAEKAILLLKENLNGLMDLSHLGGMRDEQLRITKLVENRICFDHKNGCDHAGCYALTDLINLIKAEA